MLILPLQLILNLWFIVKMYPAQLFVIVSSLGENNLKLTSISSSRGSSTPNSDRLYDFVVTIT